MRAEGGVVMAAAARRQKASRRQVLFQHPAALSDMALRGLIRVNVRRLAVVSKVSRPTIERWLRGESISPPCDAALRRACSLPEPAAD